MSPSDLSRFETEIKRVAGVSSARVVGKDAPSEIHIVASASRGPKQIVRDVQSLASAGFGIQIDHRIVSVVQLDEPAVPVEASVNGTVPASEDGHHNRPVLDRVVLASKGNAGWVKVALRWPNGEVTEGVAAASSSREARARGALTALNQAMQQLLDERNAWVEVDNLAISSLGHDLSISVRAVWHEAGRATTLLGSAFVQDDIATAAVRAGLHALNRQLG
jgi:hypothetical protein